MFVLIYKAAEFSEARVTLPFSFIKIKTTLIVLCMVLNKTILYSFQLIHSVFFFFRCISAGLPKTEASWHDVIYDLKRIENLIQVSTHFSIK